MLLEQAISGSGRNMPKTRRAFFESHLMGTWPRTSLGYDQAVAANSVRCWDPDLYLIMLVDHREC
jgi:hypothetical protein